MIVAFGFAAQREALVARNDFSAMWTGARAVLDGVDPYDRAQWPAELARYDTQRTHEDFFGYPPWATLALLPFGALPLAAGAWAWTAAGLVAAAAGLRALLRVVAPGLPVVHTLAGLTLLASQPGIATFWDGQWGFVLLGALALAAAGVVRGRSSWVLAALAMLAKPQLFPFAAWALADAMWRRGQRAALARLAAASAVAVVVASVALRGWYAAWLGPSFFGRVAGERAPTTIAAAAQVLFGPAGVWLAVAVVGAGVAVALAFDRRGDAALAVWLSLSSALVCYAWSYDHVLLVVPVVLATGVLARRSRRAALVFAAAAFAFLLVGTTLLYAVADARSDESLSAVVPLAIFLACGGALWRQRREIVPATP